MYEIKDRAGGWKSHPTPAEYIIRHPKKKQNRLFLEQLFSFKCPDSNYSKDDRDNCYRNQSTFSCG